MIRILVLLLGLLLAACVPAAPTSISTKTAFSTTEPAATVPLPSATSLPTATTAPTFAGQTPSAAPTLPPEQPVEALPLTGPLAEDRAEVSALGWYSDHLILVPQFPTRMCDTPGGCLFALPEGEITAFLDGSTTAPLDPRPIPLNTGGLETSIAGFEGFEAIAFHYDDVYLTIEASPGTSMVSYIIRGSVSPDLSAIHLDPAALTTVEQPTFIPNFSHEAIFVDDNRLLLFYEANGSQFAGDDGYAQVAAFSLDLQPLPPLEMTPIEFRLTDTAPRGAEPGAFWAMNYFFPGDLHIYPEADPLAEQFGLGSSHDRSIIVERILPMQVTGGSIIVAGPPVQLQLDQSITARNWEGLSVLPGCGFLIITDKFPGTILAFVPWE